MLFATMRELLLALYKKMYWYNEMTKDIHTKITRTGHSIKSQNYNRDSLPGVISNMISLFSA